MIYQKSQAPQGAWAKASELGGIKIATIVNETIAQPSQFLDQRGLPKTQDVAKVMFQGYPESLNVALNKTTINGLIDAFGEDSKLWMNKPLSVETERVRVAGKTCMALYLIPRGFVKIDDQNGFACIVRGENKRDYSAYEKGKKDIDTNEDINADLQAESDIPSDFL